MESKQSIIRIESESSSDVVTNENIEIRLLLEAIFLKYGYDFRNYAKAHLKRRIKRRLAMTDLTNISEMVPQILYDQGFFEKLLLDLSVNVTKMFRDPIFYRVLRNDVLPVLRTYPFVKVWDAGCSTGEEMYSLAILFKEEDLYDRSQIYATDFNQIALQKARDGIYPLDEVKEYTKNYQKSGGRSSLSDYYLARYDSISLNKSLKKRIVFSDHNLVTDGVFGEMNMIVCRNVLIYFDKELQDRVIHLFWESLCPGGFLCLGSKESLRFNKYGDRFQVFDEREKVYKKKYQ